MEQGWDPEVKQFFRKIISSFSYGMIWLMGAVTLGFYYKLAFRTSSPLWYNVVYYVLLVLSFAILLRYYHRLWKKKG